MSAQSASDANPFPAEGIAEIRIPGSDRTYEVRDVLRGMGLRWDPATRAWHGRLIGAQRAFLASTYGLAAQAVRTIEAFARAEVAPSPPRGPVPPLPTRPRMQDGFRTSREGSSSRGNSPRRVPSARTCFESRLALGAADADEDDPAEEIPTGTRRFSLLETTSGLPDDSREADEKWADRRLRELWSQVKVARAVVASTPGLAQVLEADWRKAALFYGRLGITEAQLRNGIATGQDADDPTDSVFAPRTDIEERQARTAATVPTCNSQRTFT